MQPQDQNRQQYILNHEIRLLEKRKSELLTEVERLDVSKQQEYQQVSFELKDLKKRRDQLLEEVERLRLALSSLTSTYEEARTSLQTFRETQLVEVKKELEMTRQAAKSINESAFSTKAQAEKLFLDAKKKENDLAVWEDVLLKENQSIRLQKEDIVTRTQVLIGKQTESESILAKLQEEIGAIRQMIEDLTKQKVALDQKIIEETEQLARANQKLDERTQTLEIREVALTQKEQLLSKKEQALLDQQRLIDDRRGTLERAVAEMQAKGVVI